jgi:uncharacterized protein
MIAELSAVVAFFIEGRIVILKAKKGNPMSDWQKNLIEDEQALQELLANTKRVAVLGIKTEAHAGEAAFYVARYLVSAGLEVVPVPVYFPEVTEILQRPVYRTLRAIPEEIDMVNVFRRPKDIPAHLEDILAAKPKSVWFQLGIRNDEAAEVLAKAGIKVVQDRCLMVDHRREAYHFTK